MSLPSQEMALLLPKLFQPEGRESFGIIPFCLLPSTHPVDGYISKIQKSKGRDEKRKKKIDSLSESVNN